MSSIISDIFYGSKQNLLDNYLINRQPQQQSHSHSQKHNTHLYSSFIQFIITFPIKTSQTALKVEVEMGNRSDEAFIDLNEHQQVILTIDQLEKQDLNKYTNIKITVSEGKYSKMHGFIPIETIKNIASSFSNEKTMIVQMKGKNSLPFSTLQCTIRAEFPTNNVLNSDIMKSLDKDNSELKSKEVGSDESYQTYTKQSFTNNKRQQIFPNRDISREVSIRERKQKNIVIEDDRNTSRFGTTEFVKEVKSVLLRFSKLDLNESLEGGIKNVRLKAQQKEYLMEQIIQIMQIRKQGVCVELMNEETVIGTVHLSALLLTLDKISGQLPVYSSEEHCIGTIFVQSPNTQPKTQPIHSTTNNASIHPSPSPQPSTGEKQLFLLSIDKIIVLTSLSQSNQQSSPLAQMESKKIEVLIRLNGQAHRFTDTVFYYQFDTQSIKSIELRRKQGFLLRYFEQAQPQLTVEIELFCEYRLISYSKACFQKQQHFSHKFMGGDTMNGSLHCGLYLKGIHLRVGPQYFQQHKIIAIFDILEDLIHNRVILKVLNDDKIKEVMNIHKKVTYVQLKKLFMLLHCNLLQVKKFQSEELGCIYEGRCESESMIELSGRLLQEFLYLDYKNEKSISKVEFDKIMQFYSQNLKMVLGQKYRLLVENSIRVEDKILYLFLIGGYYFIPTEQPVEVQAGVTQQNEVIREKEPMKQNREASKAEIAQNIKEVAISVQPKYFLSKISITNAHLLNLGKAPNLTLSLTKKICYSNSNPEFIIQKDVNLLDSIKIYHKSIAEDRSILLAQFKPTRRQTYYELQPSGKCLAKILWGL